MQRRNSNARSILWGLLSSSTFHMSNRIQGRNNAVNAGISVQMFPIRQKGEDFDSMRPYHSS